MNCPICNSAKNKRLGEKNSFEIIKCFDCLTIFANKIKDSVNNFDYANYYHEENLDIPEFVYETYRKVIKGFEKHRGNNRFLDVGCGAGTLLDIAKELKWEATGVEVSKAIAEHLNKRGLNVFAGTLEEGNFPDDHFDAITCTEVIEHVPNPKEFLTEISRILSPNGILWMTTPHGGGFSGKLMGIKWDSAIAPPEHLNIFSMKSMKICLEEAGFKKFRIISSGMNPFEAYRFLRGGNSNSLPEKQNRETLQETTEENLSGFDLVKKGYDLNKWFVGGKNKQKMKDIINSMLGVTNMGDTIKVWATFK